MYWGRKNIIWISKRMVVVLIFCLLVLDSYGFFVFFIKNVKMSKYKLLKKKVVVLILKLEKKKVKFIVVKICIIIGSKWIVIFV